MKASFPLYSILSLLYALSTASAAAPRDIEITPYIGQMFSGDILGSDGATEISVSDDLHMGLAFAWQATNQGQGQILINTVSHDFTGDLDEKEHTIDIIYAHFSGVAQFKQQNYSTTV